MNRFVRVSPVACLATLLLISACASTTTAPTSAFVPVASAAPSLSDVITVARAAVASYSSLHPTDPRVKIASDVITGISDVYAAQSVAGDTETKALAALKAAVTDLLAADSSPVVQQYAPLVQTALASIVPGTPLKAQAISTFTALAIAFVTLPAASAAT